MMLAVEVDQQTGNKQFSFFDPNLGIHYTDNIVALKELLVCFAKFYEKKEISDNEIRIGTRFCTKSNEKSDYQRNNFIEREKVELTILNRLIEEEETIKLTDKVSIKYLDYDKANNLTELRLTNHGRLFNDNKLIFINDISPDEIKQYIENNYNKLLAIPTEKIYLGKDGSNFCSFSILPISDESELLHTLNKKKAIDVNSIGLMV